MCSGIPYAVQASPINDPFAYLAVQACRIWSNENAWHHWPKALSVDRLAVGYGMTPCSIV